MEEWEECHSYHEILRVSFLITWNGDDKNILGEILARGLPRSIENQSCISRYKSKICGLKYSIYLGHFGTFWDVAPQCDMDHIANIFILHIFKYI